MFCCRLRCIQPWAHWMDVSGRWTFPLFYCHAMMISKAANGGFHHSRAFGIALNNLAVARPEIISGIPLWAHGGKWVEWLLNCPRREQQATTKTIKHQKRHAAGAEFAGNEQQTRPRGTHAVFHICLRLIHFPVHDFLNWLQQLLKMK